MPLIDKINKIGNAGKGVALAVAGGLTYMISPNILLSGPTIADKIGAVMGDRTTGKVNWLDLGVTVAEMYAGYSKKFSPFVYATLVAGVPTLIDGLTKVGVDLETAAKQGFGKMAVASGIAALSYGFRRLVEKV